MTAPAWRPGWTWCSGPNAARSWARAIYLNSIDADGAKSGYELTITRMVSDTMGIPVIASGGAGNPQHMVNVVAGRADAALIASIVHFGEYFDPANQADSDRKGRGGKGSSGKAGFWFLPATVRPIRRIKFLVSG